MSATKDLIQALGASKPNSFVFLTSVEDNAPNIHCYISKELVAEKGLNAGNVIRELGQIHRRKWWRTTVLRIGKR